MIGYKPCKYCGQLVSPNSNTCCGKVNPLKYSAQDVWLQLNPLDKV
ncbi:MAG: hypothetical protein ACUVUS_04225 [Thermoproteota archaeon]